MPQQYFIMQQPRPPSLGKQIRSSLVNSVPAAVLGGTGYALGGPVAGIPMTLLGMGISKGINYFTGWDKTDAKHLPVTNMLNKEAHAADLVAKLSGELERRMPKREEPNVDLSMQALRRLTGSRGMGVEDIANPGRRRLM